MDESGVREVDNSLGSLLSVYSPRSRERAVLHQMTASTAPMRCRPRSRGSRCSGRPGGHPRRGGPDPHPSLALLPDPEAASAPDAPGRREIALQRGPADASLSDRAQEVAVGVAAADVVLLVHGQRREVGVRSGVG